MQCWSAKFSQALAHPRTRGWLHAGLLMLGAVGALAAFFHLKLWYELPTEPDKLQHFLVGRWLAAGVFLVAYFAIISRVLLVARTGRSLTRMLLIVPILLAGGLFLALAIVLLCAVGKEGLDLVGGFGSVEWLDVSATLAGAATLAPAVALIMACTPVFIPLDLLMQLPRLMFADMRTGLQTIDIYVRASREHADGGRPAAVLLVEDDIVCATTAMNFCRVVGLRCHHVSSIAEADTFLRAHLKTIRLVLLDNFVRADDRGRNITGRDWLLALKALPFFQQRRFLVVVISGHTSLLGQAAEQVDLVLQKPWQPRQLLQFLKQHGF
ncbi:MAG: hypothetical protein COX17_02230 [Deltaproteobacteria bacterium CG23_combo_of_CG06-09_8_20_14_all_60_8]|nr:MAG: hypothetical protein AUK28_07345 [Desulfobacterales bacterium CG2_30_60_27]PIP44297.1 MAG: hypothetical protein COX17_02230 [Deltaproteobacteria bacterium CG23_combo_of_CG06-09_8_20_14_all_60_8]